MRFTWKERERRVDRELVREYLGEGTEAGVDAT